MLINFSKHADDIIVMHLVGELDASNYAKVIDKAQEAYEDGARRLVIDLSQVPYVSSAGLMSLHTVTLVFGGQSMQSKATGRPTFRPLNITRDGEIRKRVKLLGPQPAVDEVLDVVGLKEFFEIYQDLDDALQSF